MEVDALGAVAAAIVDSRNMLHQAGDAIGVRSHPTVPGVRGALGRLGFQVDAVHIGLALARQRDQQDLAFPHAANLAYQQSVLADGGDVLLGELHCKPGGAVEEKMVDAACCVRITRYVDEIAYKRTNVEAIVVLSKDIDLMPAIAYAMSMQVPIFAGALDVVQHRPHPFLLLGPHAYAEMTGAPGVASGHGFREQLTQLLYAQQSVPWTVEGTRSRPLLRHASGLLAVAAQGVALGVPGTVQSLYPVDVAWKQQILGSFPLLVCDKAAPRARCWAEEVVKRRTAPMTVELVGASGTKRREPYPLGGIVPGDRVLSHRSTGRVLGRLARQASQRFDPDTPQVLRVVTILPRGGALVADAAGARGLLTTNQSLRPGQRIAAVQIDANSRGAVWAAIGTPLS